MKCPHCGAWNQAYLPRCNKCGTPLEENNGQKTASWEEAMHKKKPSLQVLQFEPGEKDVFIPEDDRLYDPDNVDRAELRDELEELEARRELGEQRKAQMIRERAEHVRRSIREAEIIRPVQSGSSPEREGDSVVITRRQKARQEQYIRRSRDEEGNPITDEEHGYFGDPAYEQPLVYADDDKDAPYYYDGFTPESDDPVDHGDMPRRIPSRAVREDISESHSSSRRKKNRIMKLITSILLIVAACAVIAGVAIFGTWKFVNDQNMQVRKENETRVELTKTEVEVDGQLHPAHTITIYGRENATIFFKEMQSSYVIADGRVTVTVPDYMWYDTESSTFAKAVETDTMDVTVTPFIRYSQEGDQYELDPITFTIDVKLSPIYLLNPATIYADVGVSIYEVRLNVEKGSTVVIDGTNVSTLIRETGNVSKNVQVLPVGDNIISISVKSKYCRENKMEVTLHREAQDIPLELAATVLVEWNYEPISQEKYDAASDEDRAKMQIPSISGTTLPGADITVEFPHRKLEVDKETGKFSFVPLFSQLGDNEVVIRASIEGKNDSVITHTVYYMPNADLYTRRAWDLDSQYNDLINYISMRKGTIYVATGTIQRVISSAPQMAIMNIGSDTFEKLVMLENSSKTTWEVGTKYRIYGDAYGLYNNMPRLTVRYTYLTD
ncbi:MAG: hypothetical protein J6K32_01255 [Clostridia bacterium]|nr:hypothetical protein [Clostridia bacterium]